MTRITVFVGILLVVLAPNASVGEEKSAPDDAAIRQAVQSYVEAFNRADPAAVAAHWSENGVYVTPSGKPIRGRKEIETALSKLFRENEGLSLQVSPSSIRFPSASRAIETGTATVARPGQAPEKTEYVAAYVKKGGQWKLENVREKDAPALALSYENLKGLEWLIGEWIDADQQATVDTVYQWAPDKSFITGSFTVKLQDRIDLQGTQVIGWDPVRKTIRSWVFDSQGGFGEGVWTKQGDQWQAKSTSVLPSGEKASAINIFTYVDPNTFTFQSVGRETGGEPLPNIEEVKVVRKQSVPRRGASKRGGR